MASSCATASGAGFDGLDEQVAGQVAGRSLSALCATSLLFWISQDFGPSAETSNINKSWLITTACPSMLHYHWFWLDDSVQMQ